MTMLDSFTGPSNGASNSKPQFFVNQEEKRIDLSYKTGNNSGICAIKSTLHTKEELELVNSMESLGFFYVGRFLNNEIPEYITDAFDFNKEDFVYLEGNSNNKIDGKLIFIKNNNLFLEAKKEGIIKRVTAIF